MLGFVSFSCPTEHSDGELIEQHACSKERKNVAVFLDSPRLSEAKHLNVHTYAYMPYTSFTTSPTDILSLLAYKGKPDKTRSDSNLHSTMWLCFAFATSLSVGRVS